MLARGVLGAGGVGGGGKLGGGEPGAQCATNATKAKPLTN